MTEGSQSEERPAMALSRFIGAPGKAKTWTLVDRAIREQAQAERRVAKHIREGNAHYADAPDYVEKREEWAANHEDNARRLYAAREAVMRAVREVLGNE